MEVVETENTTMSLSEFKKAVAGRKIFNKPMGVFGKLPWVYRIYADKPWQLRKILEGVHGVYELDGEPSVLENKRRGRPFKRATAEAWVSEHAYSGVAKSEAAPSLGNPGVSSNGILLRDKTVDSAQGSYQIDARKEREWRMKKEKRDRW